MASVRAAWALLAGGLLFGLAAFVAGTADAAPEPNYNVRLRADFHIQVELDSFRPPVAYPGECQVSGTVAHVFRSRLSGLEVGDSIEIATPCDVALEGQPPATVADAEELESAPVIEVFLNARDGAAYEMAGSQYMALKAVTDEPMYETERAGIMC